MQFEYLAAQLDKTSAGADAVRFVNGEELPDWETAPFHIFLNQAGMQGWDLVGETFHGSYLVFKRAVPQQAPAWGSPPPAARPQGGSPYGVM